MKNSILTVLAITTLVACKKSKTTTIDHSADSTSMMAPAEHTTTPGEPANMSGTKEHMSPMTDQDKQFAEAAAKGGMMEVMLGKIAETNASNEHVKALGKLMVDDHTKIDNELKNWASKVSYELPTVLDASHQKKVDDLKMKKGMDFDKAYTELMISDHKMDIAEFKKEISNGTEASLKSFASATVPTLEHHLMKAEEAKKALK
ncbi:DUF4142 domain-containing protein [Chryseobacterium gotjawalense]|uniref:DUF4142 domain-containing protein n=1 Tax=Chryseobacterium gotjawalense TaxID=3042315 RepID=A0ABY8R903_9FLAO|nr:DUF4142 domain-containing protein [Chryseobacterium sp. wdc7]WHF50415.1 DUF4142 domain-containing protein [Chryseobacterium sp. wdc7]